MDTCALHSGVRGYPSSPYPEGTPPLVTHAAHAELYIFSIWLNKFCGFLPPANEVCEGYVFTDVCLSTGGVCPIACWIPSPPHRHPQTDTPLGRHPLGQTPPWADTPLSSACWDTVNKRAVRIPLECILVYFTIDLFFRKYVLAWIWNRSRGHSKGSDNPEGDGTEQGGGG